MDSDREVDEIARLNLLDLSINNFFALPFVDYLVLAILEEVTHLRTPRENGGYELT